MYGGLLWAGHAGLPWAAGAAFGWFVAARLAYVLFAGLSLRDVEGRAPAGAAAAEAYRRFRGTAAALMNNDGAALGLVCWISRGSLNGRVPPPVSAAVGGALVLLGVGVKVWAARTLDPGAYYWRSFFLPREEGEFLRRGPYRFMVNPMYTVGYAHAYGLAVLLRSFPGLLAAVLAHVLILLFHFLVERPHNRRRRGDGAPGPALAPARNGDGPRS